MVNIKNLNVSGKNAVIARPNNKVTYNAYLNSIGDCKPLSREDEILLFKKLPKAKNPEQIKEKICRHNLLFVVSVAKLYAYKLNNSIVSLEDLISEGNYGLYYAIDRFDYKSGNKFISYAVWHIRQQILKCICDNIRNIRVPPNKQSLMRWFIKQEAEMEQLLSRPIGVNEIMVLAKEKGLIHKKTSEASLMDTLNSSHIEISLSTTLYDDGDATIADTIHSTDSDQSNLLVDVEMVQNLHKMLDKAPPTIKEYLMDYFGLDGREPLTFREIAEKNNNDVTTEAVRQRIKKWLHILKRTNRVNKKYFTDTIN